jgi:outer membrane biosynthesis protein TonB
MRILKLALLLCFLAPLLPAVPQATPTLPTVTKFECPHYPPQARSAHISATVKMQVTTDGHVVTDVKIISGPPMFAQPAESNVRTWKFADHPPTTFTVTYVYAEGADYKKDPVTKCAAKMDLPGKVTVSR